MRTKTVHRCGECGVTTPRWTGRCPGCEAWNTLVEERDEPRLAGVSTATPPAGPLVDVDVADFAARSTGIGEFDRVLGGGLVPGSVTLLGGEPGIGKSTLALHLLAAEAAGRRRCLLVAGEESPQQVRLRAERLDALDADLWVVAETTMAGIRSAITASGAGLVVVDSIQTAWDPELGSTPGSVGQIRECAHQLVRLAKEAGCAVVLVGHVTKEGGIAGPRVLEHVVDTVLSFEGDRHHALRMLRALKHRFGATGELGLFEMTETGLVGLPDPSGLLLGDRQTGASGSAVVAAVDGHRPLLVEVQALVSTATTKAPRPFATGIDANRLPLILAVLAEQGRVQAGEHDVYASAAGGIRIAEPAADLALALAVASSIRRRPVPGDLVAIGELGLTGELRQVPHTARRLAEAARLGFRRALVPMTAPDGPGGITLERVPTLSEAIDFAGLGVQARAA